MRDKLLFSDLTYKIRGCCFELYKELSYGHKEVIYKRGLSEKLKKIGLKLSEEKQIPIYVENKKVGVYIPDLVVEDKIIIETKAKLNLLKTDIEQFWHYLKSTRYKLGLLINFGKPGGVEIIRRIYDSARHSA
ncbi:MAG: GxxExxY protein [Microgenomates group bacterium]